jgi:hypothetical protein
VRASDRASGILWSFRLRYFRLLTLIELGAGCGSSSSSTSGSDEAPDDFMKTMIGYSFKGQYGRVCDLLHPGEKQFVSREAFQDCNQGDAPTSNSTRLTVEIYDDPIDVPGIPQRTSKAVTLKIAVRQGDATESVTRTSTRSELTSDRRGCSVRATSMPINRATAPPRGRV